MIIMIVLLVLLTQIILVDGDGMNPNTTCTACVPVNGFIFLLHFLLDFYEPTRYFVPVLLTELTFFSKRPIKMQQRRNTHSHVTSHQIKRNKNGGSKVTVFSNLLFCSSR